MKELRIQDLNISNKNILVEPSVRKGETDSGLVKPVQYEDKAEFGIILKSGDEQFKKGMTVFFNKYAPTKIEIEGKEVLVVRSEDIIAYL